MIKKYKDYTPKHQASSCCPYCLASAEMDCDCELEITSIKIKNYKIGSGGV